MSEVVFEHKLVVIRVKLSVGLLDCVLSFLELLSELIHQSVCSVHRLCVLEAASLVEAFKELKVREVFRGHKFFALITFL